MQAMRQLATPAARDACVVAGESGAAGIAGLLALRARPELFDQAGLDASSRVLVFNTEGATDPELYRDIVYGGAAVGAGKPSQFRWIKVNDVFPRIARLGKLVILAQARAATKKPGLFRDRAFFTELAWR
jgi:hypothetical protein